MQWLDKSLEKDYALAILTKARLLLQGDVLEKNLILSEELFIKYIDLENDYNVLFEFAKNHAEGLFGDIDYTKMFNLLEQCFENSEDEKLKNDAYTLFMKIKKEVN